VPLRRAALVVALPRHGAALRQALPAEWGARRFLGRAAHGLAYASQREDAVARAHRRAAGIHRRLGGEARLASAPVPPRPRGMRRRTYERLVAGLREHEDALGEAFLAGAARLLARRRG
jgi:hypothetical protein